MKISNLPLACYLPSILLAGQVIAGPGPMTIPLDEIDLSQGVIDGKAAASYWPTEGFEGTEIMGEPSMEVHLVPADRRRVELVYPAKEWILPEASRFRYWLEGDGWMSPTSYVGSFKAVPFAGKGKAVLRPVVPAGEVCVSAEEAGRGDIDLRLMHTESHNQGPSPGLEVFRWVKLRGAECHPGGVQAECHPGGVQAECHPGGVQAEYCVRMPEGKVVASWSEVSKEEYFAISRPFQVTAREKTYIKPEPPEGVSSSLLVVLQRREPLDAFDGYDVELAVRGPELSPVKADVLIPTPGRIYGIWHELGEKWVTLTVDSKSVFMKSEDIVLRAGKVESFDGELHPLPQLDVTLELPDSLPVTGARTLDIRTRPTKTLVEQRELASGTRSIHFENVPASPLEITLSLGSWWFVERVDLSDGTDGNVVFDPQPIEVQGTVFRGTEKHPAVISFRMRPGTEDISVETDEDGYYEVALFHPRQFLVAVELEGQPGGPYREYLKSPVSETPVLDFHIPANDFTVRVVDDQTGEGIGGATVRWANVFGEDENVSEGAETDAEGWIALSALREGSLEVSAKADDYRQSAFEHFEVLAEYQRQEIVIRLQELGETDAVRVLLPDGSKAISTKVIAVRSLADDPLWSGQVDSDGIVKIPAFAKGSMLLLRHPAASFLLRTWNGSGGPDEPLEWRLPEKGPPASVLVKNTSGQPSPWTSLAVWIDGVKFSNMGLSLLTGRFQTNREGLWQLRNFPQKSFKILAVSRRGGSSLESLPETLATTIAFPWGAQIEIEAF